jgi:hypothetical protein
MHRRLRLPYLLVFALSMAACVTGSNTKGFYVNMEKNIEIVTGWFSFNDIIMAGSHVDYRGRISYDRIKAPKGSSFMEIEVKITNRENAAQDVDLKNIVIETKNGNIQEPVRFIRLAEAGAAYVQNFDDAPLRLELKPGAKRSIALTYVFKKDNPPLNLLLFGGNAIPLVYDQKKIR